MKDIPLKDFVDKHNQSKAAEIIGVGQSAVSQMIAAGRAIFFRKVKSGFEVYEIRPLSKPA